MGQGSGGWWWINPETGRLQENKRILIDRNPE